MTELLANLNSVNIAVESIPTTQISVTAFGGVPGPIGPPGPPGPPGGGGGSVPIGGATNQVLTKNSGTSGDTAWKTQLLTSVAGRTGDVTLGEGDIANLSSDLAAKYSSGNPPPYPVTSVAGHTGAVTLAETDIIGLAGDLASKAPTASPTFTGTVTVPTTLNSTDAAQKAYVDGVASGLDVKQSVNEATTAPLAANTYNNGSSGVGATLTGNSTGVLTVDGQVVILNDRVLVKNESTAANNGIYVCTTAGAVGVAYVLTRSTDMDLPAQVPGAFTLVISGSTNLNNGFVVVGTGPFTIGTTAINWTQFSGSGAVPDATAVIKGKLQLAGDLGGTASSPTVTNLHLGGDTAIGHKFTSVTDPSNAQDAATKNYVDTTEALLAPLASPALTGIPTAPTAAPATNTTQLATTAYVEGEIVANATPDATASVKGKLQLAGDLGGTASVPTVNAATFSAAGKVKQTVYNVRDYGVKGDVQTVADGAMMAGNTTLNSATASFQPSDVNKNVSVTNVLQRVSGVGGNLPSGSNALTIGAFLITDVSAAITVTGANSGGNLVTTIASVSSTSGVAVMTAVLSAPCVALTFGATITGTVTFSGLTFTGKMTDGSTTLTITTAMPSFGAMDVGNPIVVAGAGAAGADLTTTIISLTDYKNAVIGTNGSTTVRDSAVNFGYAQATTTITGYTSATAVTIGVTPYWSNTAQTIIWATDDSAAILAACTAAGAANGGVICIPPGNYGQGAHVNCTSSNIQIIGSGKQSTILTCLYDGTTGPENTSFGMLAFNSPNGTIPTGNITVKDISFNLNNLGTDAIHWRAPVTASNTANNFTADGLEIYNRGPDNTFSTGCIRVTGKYTSVNGTLRNLTIRNCIFRDGGATSPSFASGASIFIATDNLSHVRIVNNIFRNTYDTTVKIINSNSAIPRTRMDWVFEGNQFYNTGGTYANNYFGNSIGNIADAGRVGFDGLRVINNHFEQISSNWPFQTGTTNVAPQYYDLELYQSDGLVIKGNTFRNGVNVIAPGYDTNFAHLVLAASQQHTHGMLFTNNTVFNYLRFSDPDGHIGGTYSNNIFWNVQNGTTIGGYGAHGPCTIDNNIFIQCGTACQTNNTWEFALIGLEDGGNVVQNNLFYNDPVLPTPGALTATATNTTPPTPGVLTGNYLYKVTFVSVLNNESIAGTTSTVVSPSAQEVKLTNIPLGPAGTYMRRIYRTASGGADGTQVYLTSVSDNVTTTIFDNVADSSLLGSAPYPTTNATVSNLQYYIGELGEGGANKDLPNVFKNNTVVGPYALTSTFYLDSYFKHHIIGNTGLTEPLVQNSAANGSPAASALPTTDIVQGNYQSNGLPVLNDLEAGGSMFIGKNIFAGMGASFSQSNSQFFWDDFSKRLGIGVNGGTAGAGFKQNVCNSGQNSFSAGAVSTFTASFTKTCLVGDTLIGVFYTEGTTVHNAISSITDTQGNMWVQDLQSQVNGGSSVTIIRSIITTQLTSSDSITVNFGLSTNVNCVINEYFGSVITKDESASDSSISNLLTGTATGSGGITQAKELVISVLGTGGGVSQAGISLGSTTPSLSISAHGDSTNNNNFVAIADGLSTSIVTPSVTWNWTHVNNHAIAIQTYLAPAFEYLEIGASTTASASVRIHNGATPTSPNSGDLWFDGMHLQFRNGPTTDQLDSQAASTSFATLTKFK